MSEKIPLTSDEPIIDELNMSLFKRDIPDFSIELIPKILGLLIIVLIFLLLLIYLQKIYRSNYHISI